MEDYFDTKGHLTTAAFLAMAQGSADDESMFDIAEHLAFCDACTLSYATFLEGIDLVAPVPSLKEPVMEGIRRQSRRLFVSRYATLGLAASISLALWFTGAFTLDFSKAEQPPRHQIEERTDFGEKISRTIEESLAKLKGVLQYGKE